MVSVHQIPPFYDKPHIYHRISQYWDKKNPGIQIPKFVEICHKPFCLENT